MTKNELINDVVFVMNDKLDRNTLDFLKITLLVKLQNYEITEITTLPVVSDHNNEWFMKRYTIDAIAKGIKTNTIKQYMFVLKAFFAHCGKNYNEVTAQDITDYLAVKEFRDKVSPNYKSSICRYLIAVFGWAYKKKHISNDIASEVEKARPVDKRKERFTDDEVEDIRDNLKTLKERALFELMMCTGMRVGEIANLNINDIDFKKNRIVIYGEKTNSYREGYLSMKAARASKKYISSREFCEKAVFVSDRKPYQRLTKAGIERIAKDMAKRAGVHITGTVHDYRKTFASVLFKKTHDIVLVSKLLGHAGTNTTIKYYLCVDIEEMQSQFSHALN